MLILQHLPSGSFGHIPGGAKILEAQMRLDSEKRLRKRKVLSKCLELSGE